MNNSELESLLEPALKTTITEVIELLKAISNKYEKIGIFDQVLDLTDVEQLLNTNNIKIYASFKESLISPYALAKYIMLIEEETELTSKVENVLNKYLSNNISWTIKNELTNEIHFTKYTQDKKTQGLLVKYFYDTEADLFNFTIAAGPWGWDLNIQQLKALLEDKYIENVDYKSTISTNIEPLTLTYNGMEITIKPKHK